MLRSLVQTQRVTPAVLSKIVPAETEYRAANHLCTAVRLDSDGSFLLINSAGRAKVRVARAYWNIVSIKFPKARIYAIARAKPVVVEVNEKPVALVMPLAY